MYLLILLLPFLSFFFSFFFGFFFGKKICIFLNIFSLLFSFLISLFIFYEVALCRSNVLLNLFNWVTVDIYRLNISFYFDTLTTVMILLILFISLLVHIYSVGYMSHDPYIISFLSYLSLFTFFMLFMVTASNYLILFLGWEGVGLCSYLLINFWHTRILANKAALKAMIMNRIGDVFLLVGIMFTLYSYKTLDFLVLNSLTFDSNLGSISFLGLYINVVDLICFFILIGAFGKSAQLGLHTWLPDAMEGPTPVSSLLHAATMVTAGVFLVIRSSFLFELSPNMMSLLFLMGLLGSVFFATIGIFQTDIKKIIAYSTCSQLGYMFFSCGLSNYDIAIFHLFNHGFFKALLFLSAGSVIHSLYDEQDIRKMGGLSIFLPFTYLCFVIGSLAIVGFPFLTGFYSKDILLESANIRFIIDGLFIYNLGLLAAMMTCIYSVKLLIVVFFFKINFFRNKLLLLESTSFMLFSLIVLAFMSFMAGYFFSDFFIGLGSDAWESSIFIDYKHHDFINIIYLSPFIKHLPFLLSLFSGVLCYISLYIFDEYSFLKDIKLLKIFNEFFFFAGFFNLIYNLIFIKLYNALYKNINKNIDKGFLEFLGPWGLYKFFRKLNKALINKYLSNIFYIISSMFFYFMFLYLIILNLSFLLMYPGFIAVILLGSVVYLYYK